MGICNSFFSRLALLWNLAPWSLRYPQCELIEIGMWYIIGFFCLLSPLSHMVFTSKVLRYTESRDSDSTYQCQIIYRTGCKSPTSLAYTTTPTPSPTPPSHPTWAVPLSSSNSAASSANPPISSQTSTSPPNSPHLYPRPSRAYTAL